MFRSSDWSIWPLYFSVNEFPPDIRKLRQNTIMAGLWFGREKPRQQTFLRPFVKTLQALYEDGVTVSIDGTLTQVKAALISGTFDKPALAMMLNIKQYNSRFGCNQCLTEAVTWHNPDNPRSHLSTFPYDRSSKTGHGARRTADSMRQNGMTAMSDRREGRGTEHVNGVKGRTSGILSGSMI